MTEKSSLRDTLDFDFKQAFRGKNELKISVLRMLKAAVMNAEIAKGGKGSFNDAQILEIVKKEAKKRQDSISAYEQGGRNDLAGKERQEFDILKAYLPKMMPEEDIRELVQKIIDDFNVAGQADFGKVMKEAVSRAQGKADGKTVSQIVKELLD